jgi:hypothetical protein
MEPAVVAVLTPTPGAPTAVVVSSSGSSDQASPGASDAPGGYVVFGTLTTALVIGLIVLWIKKQ